MKREALSKYLILLDLQSTMSVCNKLAMLTNIQESGRVLGAFTNGGHQDSSQVGDFPNLGEVWYNPLSIANILSLSNVRKVCQYTMDPSITPALHVHRHDGAIMKFKEHTSGLYVFNTKESSPHVKHYTMVTTVAQ
jgi:hypothetical protein